MLIIYDKRIPEEYTTELKKLFRFAEFLPFFQKDLKVYDSISSHPDIYFFQLDENTLVHAPGVGREFLERLSFFGVNLIRGEEDPSGKYPSTILYNAARVGRVVFLNTVYADSMVMEGIRARNLTAVNVSQGYARCSVLPASENAFITSDRKIADIGIKLGMSVLEVSCKDVKLPGEKHGFIGGIGGLTVQDEVVMLGDEQLHPQGKQIKNFIQKHAKSLIHVVTRSLYDAGGLIFLQSR